MAIVSLSRPEIQYYDNKHGGITKQHIDKHERVPLRCIARCYPSENVQVVAQETCESLMTLFGLHIEAGR